MIWNPPNPNAGLDQFLTTGSDGTVTFNSSAWQTAALANPAWGTGEDGGRSLERRSMGLRRLERRSMGIGRLGLGRLERRRLGLGRLERRSLGGLRRQRHGTLPGEHRRDTRRHHSSRAGPRNRPELARTRHAVTQTIAVDAGTGRCLHPPIEVVPGSDSRRLHHHTVGLTTRLSAGRRG